MKLFPIIRTLALLWLGLALHPARAQVYPSIAPSRILVTAKPGTTADQNVAKISWKPGDGTYYIVLIRVVDYNSPYGGAVDMVLPDDRPYKTNGNGIMDANSYVPKNPNFGSTYPPSTTYLLKTAAYTSPADTATAVLNATGGVLYEVNVFEYNTDASGTRYYTASSCTSCRKGPQFLQPRSLPVVTKLVRNGQFTDLEFVNNGESAASNYTILWNADSTAMNASYGLGNTYQVAPKGYAPASYSVSLLSPQPANKVYYYWIVLHSGNASYNYETTTTKANALAPNGPLPVSLSSFEVARSGASVLLRWNTASELNSAGFGIERSPDGSSWSQVDYVPGSGTTQQAHSYARSSAYVGAAYYRLRQEDLSGAKNYSPVRYLAADGASALAVYPNPGSGLLSLVGGDATLPVVIYNAIGQATRQLPAGSTQLNMSGQPPGIYLVRQGTSSVRVVVK
ncbi:T9SS type A sorting domain-containing protein (plasmid) [Hymenobacter sp. BRD128]|uniref:T9SS type A sorting domain-containing protein n=1 Tax=Hymenobacter sp. BRD128 TaxID=2675878 RepID=UPI001563E436|nr:T9SS type A sorting domain-containing protein [Hymenobacter sp. BRD128]QKG59072.1 T9SS type A sorting domain-containing protein [Hymenobacter sp. BRD128]